MNTYTAAQSHITSNHTVATPLFKPGVTETVLRMQVVNLEMQLAAVAEERAALQAEIGRCVSLTVAEERIQEQAAQARKATAARDAAVAALRLCRNELDYARQFADWDGTTVGRLEDVLAAIAAADAILAKP